MGKIVNKMFFIDIVFKIILFIKDFDIFCYGFNVVRFKWVFFD